MIGWRARVDLIIYWVGTTVMLTSTVAQVAALVLYFCSVANPIICDSMLRHGWWIAGLGGAGFAYGGMVHATGPARDRDQSSPDDPPLRRWHAAIWAIASIPLFAVLSLPIGIAVCSILVLGGTALGISRAVRTARRFC